MSSTSAFASKAEAPLWLAFALVAAVGCEGQPCANLPADCTALYEPTLENVYTQTLSGSCAVAGASCHASEGRQGGLDFSELERAHASLLQVADFDRLECSPILARLESTEVGFGMPPGRPLAAEERCAIRRYLEAGAPR